MSNQTSLTITGGRRAIPSHLCIDKFLSLFDKLSPMYLNHGDSGYIDIGVSMLIRYLRPDTIIRAYPVVQSLDGAWPAAGCRRNGRMLRESDSDYVVAFEGNRGTSDCIHRALDMDIVVWKWDGCDFKLLLPNL